MASLFLVSFTGIKMLVHHCMSCETTAYSLISHTDGHCPQPELAELTDESACCISEVVNENSYCSSIENVCNGCTDNCCDNEVLYFVNDYEVSFERNEFNLSPWVQALLPSLLNDYYSLTAPVPTFYTIDSQPPPKWVGKEFILFSHQLRVS